MKPILFNTDMVRAILEDRKTVTRRLVKDKDIINAWDCEEDGTPIAYIDQETGDSYPPTHRCPYRPGDILYVREAFQQNYDGSYSYRAGHKFEKEGGWRPSIHMPREAARIFLRVTDVSVAKLHDISESDAEKEGLKYTDDICQDESWHPTFYDPDSGGDPSLAIGFAKLWDSTIKKSGVALYGWDANPWVWVIEFGRISRREAVDGD